MNKKAEICVHANIPGFSRENLSANFDEKTSTLWLEGKHVDSRNVGDSAFLVRERSIKSFKRAISIPRGVDPNRIYSHFSSNGVLNVHFPKTGALEEPRKIAIK